MIAHMKVKLVTSAKQVILFTTYTKFSRDANGPSPPPLPQMLSII